MAEIRALALEELRARGASDARALAEKSVAGRADGTYLIGSREKVPTWRPRDYSQVPVGTPYQWEGLVYKLWQQHDATGNPGWSPDRAVALWDFCHTTDPKLAGPFVPPQGTRGLWQVGECCVQDGRVWRCLTADNDRSPLELPARWEDLGAVEDVQKA